MAAPVVVVVVLAGVPVVVVVTSLGRRFRTAGESSDEGRRASWLSVAPAFGPAPVRLILAVFDGGFEGVNQSKDPRPDRCIDTTLHCSAAACVSCCCLGYFFRSEGEQQSSKKRERASSLKLLRATVSLLRLRPRRRRS